MQGSRSQRISSCVLHFVHTCSASYMDSRNFNFIEHQQFIPQVVTQFAADSSLHPTEGASFSQTKSAQRSFEHHLGSMCTWWHRDERLSRLESIQWKLGKWFSDVFMHSELSSGCSGRSAQLFSTVTRGVAIVRSGDVSKPVVCVHHILTWIIRQPVLLPWSSSQH